MQYSNYTITKPVHRRKVLVAYPYRHYLNAFSHDKDDDRSGSVVQCKKRAKIRNRNNQAPQLTQDTNAKVTTSQLAITNVSPFPAGDHKAFGIKGLFVRDVQ